MMSDGGFAGTTHSSSYSAAYCPTPVCVASRVPKGSLEVTDNVLTIQGTSNQAEGVSDSQYVKREIKRSSFRRSFTLNDNLNSASIGAQFDNGILTLEIPKVVPDNTEPVTRKIEIG